MSDMVNKLVGDLARCEFDFHCEACGAGLFHDDDFVSDPDGVTGCWAAMTDLPSRKERPCYAYRVGKPSAALTNGSASPDTPSPKADDQGVQP